jgi:hypothetical protein
LTKFKAAGDASKKLWNIGDDIRKTISLVFHQSVKPDVGAKALAR